MTNRALYILCFALICFSCKQEAPKVLSANNSGLALVNGVLEFNKRPFSGILTDSFASGKLRSEIIYVDGKKHGHEKHWYNNTLLSVERFYKDGLKVGVHKAWWDNGKLKFQYHFNDKGEFHGNVKEWDRTGMIFRDFNYKKGKESGSQRLWKPDGSIKSNYEVVNGERFGLIGLKKCYTVTTNSDDIK